MYRQTLETAKEIGFYENMRKLIPAIRAAGIRVFIVPHHRAVKGDYENWLAATSSQKGAGRSMLFGAGTWGGEWHPEFGPKAGDIIVKEHWAQSGFANTDLDQQLKQHGVRRVILCGFIANTCVESTGRFAMELGYHVTFVKDATAAFSKEAMTAALLNAPTYAHAIVTTPELVSVLGEKG
jgi:nicotinamidase-related amidase